MSLISSVRTSPVVKMSTAIDSKHSSNIGSREQASLRDSSTSRLQTLPEVVYEEVSAERLSSCQSTEEICTEDMECYQFKYIPNPGLSRAYHGKGKPQETESEEKMYIEMVNQVQIPPVTRILRSLKQSAINLQYYGLDPRQIKPLSKVLEKNQTVEEVNLKGNPLDDDALYHLGQMLRKNHTLVKLDLQHCQISVDGAELLGNGLEICGSLRELDLSHNQFGDQGMELLGIKFGYNSSIKKLNLSHNNLTHKSGFYLAETMEENISIQDLDLSWNQISEPEGLKKFLYTAAEFNESLLKLNLSWNNLGGEKTSTILKNFIMQHRTIQELDVSYNKLETESETTKLAKGINSAISLKQLNLSYNGITADVGFAIISSINGHKAKLDKLIMENLWVNPEFHKLSEELGSQCGLKVVVQGVYGGTDIKPPDMQSMLLRRAHYLGNKPKKKKNKKDFGWFLLRLQKAGTLAPVKKAKFVKLIAEDKIQFDEGMVDEFAKRFKNENKRVDLELMLEKYLSMYPETILPKPKEKKKKKGLEKEESLPKEGGTDEPEKKESVKGSKEVRISLTEEGIFKEETPEGEELDTKFKTSLRSDTSKKRVSFSDQVIKTEEDTKIEDFNDEIGTLHTNLQDDAVNDIQDVSEQQLTLIENSVENEMLTNSSEAEALIEKKHSSEHLGDDPLNEDST